MCTPDGADPGGRFPGDGFPGNGAGAGCCMASAAGFRDVAQALRAGRAFAAYLIRGRRDLEGPARGEALEQLGAIASLLGAARNGLLRRFDADDGHDADGYATAAAWLAARTKLGRNDARAAVRADAPARPPPGAGRRDRDRPGDPAGEGDRRAGPAASATRNSSRKPTRSSSRRRPPGRTSTTSGSWPRPPTRPGARGSPTPTRTRPGAASATGTCACRPPWTARGGSGAT